MSILSIDRIKTGATALDKADAIRQAGALLVDTGCAKAAYIDGMLARERTMSTYLGNGVAIPHGEYDNRDDVLETAISVLQLATPVEWEPDAAVRLIIGIAAKSDEHVGVLARLAGALEDDNALEQLMSTANPGVIFDLLRAEPEDATSD